MEIFALLSHRTLSSQHHLHPNACCPTMDLAVFTGPSTANSLVGDASGTHNNLKPSPHSHRSTSFDTLSCYRLGSASPQVWSMTVNQFFTESSPCCDPSGKHVRLDPVARFDRISALHWSPDGTRSYIYIDLHLDFLGMADHARHFCYHTPSSLQVIVSWPP